MCFMSILFVLAEYDTANGSTTVETTPSSIEDQPKSKKDARYDNNSEKGVNVQPRYSKTLNLFF